MGNLPDPETRARLEKIAGEALASLKQRRVLRIAELWAQANKNKDDYEALMDIQDEMREAGLPGADIDKVEAMIDAALDALVNEDGLDPSAPGDEIPDKEYEVAVSQARDEMLQELESVLRRQQEPDVPPEPSLAITIARWVAVLPGILLGTAASSVLAMWTTRQILDRSIFPVSEDGVVAQIFEGLFTGSVWGAVPVIIAAKIAPSHKKIVAITTSAVVLIFAGTLLILFIFAEVWMGLWLLTCMVTALAIATCSALEDLDFL